MGGHPFSWFGLKNSTPYYYVENGMKTYVLYANYEYQGKKSEE